MKLRRAIRWLALSLSGIIVVAFYATTPALLAAPLSQRFGGVIKIAWAENIPTADPMTLEATLYPLFAVLEGLFSEDSKSGPVPVLAKSYQFSPDGRKLTINLRQDVRFHNGQDMTSADVRCSLERWGRLNGFGRGDWSKVERAETPDPSTIVLSFKEPSAAFVSSLSIYNEFIYPRELCERYPNSQIPPLEVVGTGPWKIAEWVAGTRFRFTRFDQYKSPGGKPDGHGGQRIAYVDEIEVLIITEAASRLAAIESGAVDIATALPVGYYQRLKQSTTVEPVIAKPGWWAGFIVNQRKPPFSNILARRALVAGINNENILKVITDNNPEFYALDAGMMKSNTWSTPEVTNKYFNKQDVAKAKQLLKAAGYNGEELIILTVAGNPTRVNAAVAMVAELEKLGVKAKVLQLDQPTAVSYFRRDDGWDMYTGQQQLVPDPVNLRVLFHCSSGVPFKWCDPRMDALYAKIEQETDFQKRRAIWGKMQDLWWRDGLNEINPGQFYALWAKSKKLRDWNYHTYTYFWNAWKEK